MAVLGGGGAGKSCLLDLFCALCPFCGHEAPRHVGSRDQELFHLPTEPADESAGTDPNAAAAFDNLADLRGAQVLAAAAQPTPERVDVLGASSLKEEAQGQWHVGSRASVPSLRFLCRQALFVRAFGRCLRWGLRGWGGVAPSSPWGDCAGMPRPTRWLLTGPACLCLCWSIWMS